MRPLNCPEQQENARYNSCVIKPQGGLNRDVCGFGFSNYGNVPMHAPEFTQSDTKQLGYS